ncbi:hypothetical protein IWQ56_004988 [Coemansia nantahalensis]|uniref:Uncharacterized protein n=1 Tax=Coemansia helicoidea TaxID=1286919 RepID=A0ACC1L541_9FUNG|nr:hypothetical protein IWQ56_004988 [Coemansia nantahalensis]KAJ2801052.1 hypothetical protein H4R21_002941 [Coemansia helicoidea]
MGGPGLEVARFMLYVFAPIGFMVYIGGPGFYERYVADDVYQFNPPPKNKLPTESSDIRRALEELQAKREERRLLRERITKEMAAEDGGPGSK